MATQMSSSDSVRSSFLRIELTTKLQERGLITSEAVAQAFATVGRHVFVPHVSLERAYADASIPLREVAGLPISSSSQPAIMAVMLEQLAVEPGHNVLEIGTGSGYNAALLAELVGEGGHVATVELERDIATEAYNNLNLAGYEHDRVTVVLDDGGNGFPEEAPYDRIIVTAAAWDITAAWWDQLKPGGRLILPLSIGGPQLSVALVNHGDVLVSDSSVSCGFMELRGEFANPIEPMRLGDIPFLYFRTDADLDVSHSEVYSWLMNEHLDHDTGLDVTPREISRGVEPWLALNMPGFAGTFATGEAAESDVLPGLFQYEDDGSNTRLNTGVASEGGLCLLMRTPYEPIPENSTGPTAFPLWIRCYGDDDALTEHVIRAVHGWNDAGRPDSSRLSLSVYPADADVDAGDRRLIRRPWTQMLAHWD